MPDPAGSSILTAGLPSRAMSVPVNSVGHGPPSDEQHRVDYGPAVSCYCPRFLGTVLPRRRLGLRYPECVAHVHVRQWHGAGRQASTDYSAGASVYCLGQPQWGGRTNNEMEEKSLGIR